LRFDRLEVETAPEPIPTFSQGDDVALLEWVELPVRLTSRVWHVPEAAMPS
jgi:hypothetical protein